MAGVAILLIVLFSIAAGLWYLTSEMYKLDAELEERKRTPRRTVERIVYGKDWDRIMRITELKKRRK